MSKTTEPAALAGIEPVAMFKESPNGTVYIETFGGLGSAKELVAVPLYSAATVERLVRERDGWIDSAREFSNGLEYYRDQLDACARHIGLPCFTADDGGVHEEPLRAKVAECVGELQEQLAALRLKCDEGISACASETCAMARDRDEYRDTMAQQSELLAAHKAEIQDWQRALLSAQQENEEYRAALELALPELGYGYDAARCPAAFNGITQAINAVKAALAKHSPEDEIERARRMV